MQKTQNYWEQDEHADELIKKGQSTMKEGFMLKGDAYAHLLTMNDLELIQKMRLALGHDAGVELKHICAYVSYLYPEHGRYIRKVFPDEWKRDYERIDESEQVPNSNYIFSGKFNDWLKTLTPDELDRVAEDVESTVKKKGPAKEPLTSDFLDVWERIGDNPQDCIAAQNLRKFADLLEATHPEHGKHFCYMVGQLPASDIDGRNDIPHMLKEEALYLVMIHAKSIREGFKKYMDEIIKKEKTPKWGSIMINRVEDWARRNTLELPTPDKDNKYTVEQKKQILHIVRSYCNPLPKIKT